MISYFGYEGGNDGLQVCVDRDRRGLQVFHCEGDEEIAEGCGTDDNEGHFEHTIPTPCCCIEGIL